MDRRRAQLYLVEATKIAALAFIYFLSAKFGLEFASVNASSTAIWPPTGIAITALLVFGYRLWPGVFIGAFFVNLVTAGSILTSLGIATGNTLEGFFAAYLVNNLANGANFFEKPWNIFKYVILAGFVSTAVSASIGVTSLALGGFANWPDYVEIWLTWWLGDMGGALVLAPLLILLLKRTRIQWVETQYAEAVFVFTCLVMASLVVFGGIFEPFARGYPIEYLSIPFLIWIAMRFGQLESAFGVFVLAVIANAGTLQSLGPFVRANNNESLLLLQAFLAVASLTSMILSAVVTESRRLIAEEKDLEMRLKKDNDSLEKFNKFMVNRELKMIQLKKEIKDLQERD